MRFVEIPIRPHFEVTVWLNDKMIVLSRCGVVYLLIVGETMNGPSFEWDAANIAYLAEHGIVPEEAEQALLNRPVDLSSEVRNGEPRIAQIGETNQERVLVVISTMSGEKIRVVTAWPANKNYRRYFASLKRSANVGRAQDDDLRE